MNVSVNECKIEIKLTVNRLSTVPPDQFILKNYWKSVAVVINLCFSLIESILTVSWLCTLPSLRYTL